MQTPRGLNIGGNYKAAPVPSGKSIRDVSHPGTEIVVTVVVGTTQVVLAVGVAIASGGEPIRDVSHPGTEIVVTVVVGTTQVGVAIAFSGEPIRDVSHPGTEMVVVVVVAKAEVMALAEARGT